MCETQRVLCVVNIEAKSGELYWYEKKLHYIHMYYVYVNTRVLTKDELNRAYECWWSGVEGGGGESLVMAIDTKEERSHRWGRWSCEGFWGGVW